MIQFPAVNIKLRVKTTMRYTGHLLHPRILGVSSITLFSVPFHCFFFSRNTTQLKCFQSSFLFCIRGCTFYNSFGVDTLIYILYTFFWRLYYPMMLILTFASRPSPSSDYSLYLFATRSSFVAITQTYYLY